MSLRIINPLPLALRHYEAALVRTLELAGVGAIAVSDVSIEEGGGRLAARGASHVHALVKARRSGVPTLLLWPSFGYCEVPLDALLCRRSAVIFHDARPMRRQFGMAPWQARMIGRLGFMSRPNQVLVHSRAAQDVLAGFGWHRPLLLPHPTMPATEAELHTADLAQRTCLVLGQHKPTRALGLLEQLPALMPDWSFRIVGRGWPPVAGWDVNAQFVSEAQVQSEINATRVLLIPYESFFQSGVLVRAFELCKPAVSVAHEQTCSLYGVNWVGIVPDWRAEAVAEAIERAGEVGPAEVRDMVVRADRLSVDAWKEYVRQLDIARS